MKFRLFHKFFAVMLLVSALPLALLGIKLIDLGQVGVRTAILELHLTQADKISSEFSSYVSGADVSLRAAGAAMSSMDWENKQTLLSSLLSTRKELVEISVLSKEGKELIKMLSPFLTGAGTLKSYSSPEFRKALKGAKSVSLDKAGRAAIFYYPFGKDMVLRAELDMSSFLGSLELTKIGQDGFPLILDSAARPIAWPEDVTAEAAAAAAAWSISREAVKAPASGSTEFSAPDGRWMLCAYSPIRETGGAVMVAQPREGAYRYAMFIKRQAVMAVALFLLLSLAAAWFLSRGLSKPIGSLTAAAESVAGGDFTRLAEVHTSDELKDLADTFNKMVGQLKTYSEMQLDRIIREQKNTEAILFSTEDGIIMTDLEGKVQLVNRKARSVLGLSAEGAVEGQGLGDLIAAESVREPVMDAFTSRKENYFREIETELQHSRRVFKCFSIPIKAPGHAEPIGRLMVFNDITLDKELARIKDEFLHSITHDLRNPMGAIKGFVEFLVKEIPGPVNEAQKKMLVSIDRAAFRLLGMINNILDIAKVEAGKMEVKLAPVNMREVAVRIIDLMESLGQRKHLRFEVDCPPDLILQSDPGLMERMFTNLIGNAIKFTPENGVITVGARDDGREVLGWVSDTGDGIPPEYLDKVFEKFEQVKGQKAGGTGLGLTICKYVAAVHQGRIWVESEPGKGAKFIFAIPKALVRKEDGAVAVSA